MSPVNRTEWIALATARLRKLRIRATSDAVRGSRGAAGISGGPVVIDAGG